MNQPIVTLTVPGGEGMPSSEVMVVLDAPTCHICDTRESPVVGFVLHKGAPVCRACVARYAGAQGQENAAPARDER